MDSEKRKTVCDGADGESDNRKKAKSAEKVDASAEAAAAPPADEEVDEFFAILRRIQVAVKYFQKRNGGGRQLTAPPWNPSFEPHDFDGVKETREKSQGDLNTGLDLNSDPGSDDPDVVSNRVQVQLT